MRIPGYERDNQCFETPSENRVYCIVLYSFIVQVDRTQLILHTNSFTYIVSCDAADMLRRIEGRSIAPETGKARLPTVERRTGGIV